MSNNILKTNATALRYFCKCLVCVSLTFSLAGCSAETESAVSEPQRETIQGEPAVSEPPQETEYAQSGEPGTTVMVYMVGSDLESEAGCASMDILEMMESGIDLSRNNVVIYTGGSREWQSGIPSSQNTLLQLVESDEGADIEVIGGMEEIENMGESQTLTDFVDYCLDNYDTEHYALICWDHGGGPIEGFGCDELYQYDSLTLDELKEALEASDLAGGKRLDWVGFDVCLMASIELADVWDEYADYLIASQETESAYGWDYSFLSILNETSNPEMIAEAAIRAYEDFFEQNSTPTFNPDATLSCMDLSRVEDTVAAMDDMFVFCQALFPEKSVKIPCFQQGNFPAFGGLIFTPYPPEFLQSPGG